MKLLFYPHPILKQKAAPIKEVTEETRRVAAAMLEIMAQNKGIGLAGNQVGYPFRIVVINLTGEKKNDLILVNPRIISAEGEEICEEGCLSFPEITGKIARAKKVCVQFTDLAGKQLTAEAEDLLARAVQHEVDHLDAVLFISRLSPAEKQAFRTKLKQLEKKYTE
ncbi:MAG: peptide deformylase [Planctomycetes bacterium]|nr:peptide deformylase [Planctomycetota bacterium]